LPIEIAQDVPIDALDTNPDNQDFVLAADDVCKIWDYEHGMAKIELREANKYNRIKSVEYDKEGDRLLCGSQDGTAKIWDLKSAKCIHVLRGHHDQIYCARWCPDNSHIATLGADKTIKVWDVRKGYELVKSEKRAINQSTIAFNPANAYLVSAGLYLYIYEPLLAFTEVFNIYGKKAPTGGSQLLENPSMPKARSLGFIPGNSAYIIAGISDGTICMCNTQDPSKSLVLNACRAEQSDLFGRALMVSPDGKTLAFGSYVENIVRLWKINQLLACEKSMNEEIESVNEKDCCSIN